MAARISPAAAARLGLTATGYDARGRARVRPKRKKPAASEAAWTDPNPGPPAKLKNVKGTPLWVLEI